MATGSPPWPNIILPPEYPTGNADSFTRQIVATIQAMFESFSYQLTQRINSRLHEFSHEMSAGMASVGKKCDEFQESSAVQTQLLEDRISNQYRATQENISTTQHLFWHEEISPKLQNDLQEFSNEIKAQIQELRDGRTFERPAQNNQQQQQPKRANEQGPADQPSPKQQSSLNKSAEPSPVELGHKRKRTRIGREEPVQSNSPPQDQQKVWLGGFFASLALKRLFKLLSKFGTVESLRRYSRGWAIAIMKTADEAKAALKLNGHWGTDKRKGIKVSIYKPWKKILPHEGEEFIGSDSHKRMQKAAAMDSNTAAANQGDPSADDKTSQGGPIFRRKEASKPQNNTPKAQLGKRRGRDEDSTPGSHAKECMQTDSPQKPTVTEEDHLTLSAEQPGLDNCNGRGGASPTNQRRKRSGSAKAKVDDHHTAAGGSSAREIDDGQGAAPLPDGTNAALLTEQEVLDKYYFNGGAGIWIPGAEYLDQKLNGEHPPRQVKNVEGDGNCQSRAIVATGQTKYSNYRSLKQAALHYLERNKSIVRQHLAGQNLINTDDEGWTRRLTTHLKSHGGGLAYGDEISIGLYAILLATEIQVYDAFDGNIYQVAKPLAANQMSQGQSVPVAVGYRKHGVHFIYDSSFQPTRDRADGHYWAIIPKQGNGLRSG